MKTISEHIAMRLAALNASHPGIKNVAASKEAGIQRVREAMERANKNLDKISFDGIEVDKNEIKIQVPEAFRKDKRVWQTADGSLMLEVLP